MQNMNYENISVELSNDSLEVCPKCGAGLFDLGDDFICFRCAVSAEINRRRRVSYEKRYGEQAWILHRRQISQQYRDTHREEVRKAGRERQRRLRATNPAWKERVNYLKRVRYEEKKGKGNK